MPIETKGRIPDYDNIYREYIACLNGRELRNLEQFVHDDVHYNGQQIGLGGYRQMLEKNFSDIPDLYFNIQFLISQSPYIASRLTFTCTPKGDFLGLNINVSSI